MKDSTPPDPRIAHIDYRCTKCRKRTARDDLTAKRAIFASMGENGRQLRSRTTAWLCGACLVADHDWNRTIDADSPGRRNTKAAQGGL